LLTPAGGAVAVCSRCAPTWAYSSIETTYDRYGHLLPGNESEAAALLDAYLERQLAI
jgi:hypothetical protein